MSEFVPGPREADPAAEALAATQADAGAVSRRMFDESGAAREVPGADAGEGLWGAYVESLDAEFAAEEDRVDPSDYPPTEHATAEGFLADQELHAQAAYAVGRDAEHAEMVEFVRHVGREYGVSDPERLAQIASVVGAARDAMFVEYLAAGAGRENAARAVSDGDFESAVRAELEAHRYDQITQNTRVGQWRQQQQANRQLAASMGLEAPRSIFQRSPSLQRMAAREAERIAKIEERKQWFRDRGYGS